MTPRRPPARLVRACVAAAAALAAVVAAAPPAAAADRWRDRQWHLAHLKVAEAHTLTRGAGVTVAVLDTGVWPGHPDLAGAVLPGVNLAGNRAGDGRVDLDGHGTAMSGIVAARGRGSGGLLGIAPEAKVLPVRQVTARFYVNGSNLSDAIRWAAGHGAGVVNMSYTVDDFPALRDAVQAAVAADVVLVAATGNRGPGFTDGGGRHPAAYPEVLAVGAVDRQGRRAPFSVTGPQVDLTAPGVDIPTPGRTADQPYRSGSGTSDASAVVAGAAALLRARFPDLSAAEVVHRLTATAADRGAPGRDDEYGHGELDLLAALTADVPPAGPSTPPVPAVSGPGLPAAAPPAGPDGGPGRGLLFVGLGVLLLAGATAGGVLFARRARAARIG